MSVTNTDNPIKLSQWLTADTLCLTGTSITADYCGDAEFYWTNDQRGDAAWQPKTYDDQPKIWKCIYCGAQHWIKDEELQCKKCGAPREDI